MTQPFKEIQEIITEHYGHLKNELYIEKGMCEELPMFCNDARIEYLEKLISAYKSLFPYLD